jgi:hypothetical protein
MFACILFICLFSTVQSQDLSSPAAATTDQPVASVPQQPLPESDTAIATRHALQFADSLVKANFYADWPTYIGLSQQSAIKYYGGKDAFKEHIVIIHYRNEPKTEEKPEKVKLITLMNDIDTWQCVIEKVRETFVDGHGKTKMYSYLVGESTDNGLTWKFIDVSHNSMENVINVMPTIFGTMPIPEGKTVYVDELAAQEAAAAQAPVKKKPVVKKSK